MKLIKSKLITILSYKTYRNLLIPLLLTLTVIMSGCVSKSNDPVIQPTQISVQLPDNLMTTPSFQKDLVDTLSVKP
ncbi:Rz1-like spanin outer membrane subunit [Enterobacter quasiroggenkampii]|uniref:Rz1-like spanin outer membrane subunit n=1 Tax=Enterobacter quasiroggenkampii TaxID=2497436 RepID=UPI003AAC08D3